MEFVKRYKEKPAPKALKPKDRLKVLEFEGVSQFPLKHRLRRITLMQVLG